MPERDGCMEGSFVALALALLWGLCTWSWPFPRAAPEGKAEVVPGFASPAVTCRCECVHPQADGVSLSALQWGLVGSLALGAALVGCCIGAAAACLYTGRQSEPVFVGGRPKRLQLYDH